VRLSTIALTALVFSAIFVGETPAAAQSGEGCHPDDPTGYFTGTADGRQSGRFEVSLNLRCDDGRYDGLLVTPLGSFAVEGGSADSNHVHLIFSMGADRGTIDARSSRDTLQGSFAAAGDSGTLAVSRLGSPRAEGWDAATLGLDAAQWREDLAFFAREIVRRHGNAFHSIPRPRFDSLVSAIRQRLDSLNGDQAYVELDRLANLIGDAHTYIELPDNAARFPFAVRRFGTEYRIVAAGRGYERMLGAKLLKVQDTPASQAIQRLWSLTPANEHSSLRQARAEGFLSVGMLLHGVDITRGRDSVTLTLSDDAGELRLRVRAMPNDRADALSWTDVVTAPPLYAQNPRDSFWFRYLPEAELLYCSFRGYDSLPSRSPGLLALLGRVRPKKLVIDMRENGGGDYLLGLRHLIEPIRRLSYLNHPGRLFVIIGRSTFSAGMANAAQFRSRTAAILVGEMIGEKPNSLQEPREMRLPNSHLIVRYSTRYYRFVDRGPNAVQPDRSISPTWAEYREGLDPVLEWILRYPNVPTVPSRGQKSEHQSVSRRSAAR
jgi:hypothetical protein